MSSTYWLWLCRIFDKSNEVVRGGVWSLSAIFTICAVFATNTDGESLAALTLLLIPTSQAAYIGKIRPPLAGVFCLFVVLGLIPYTIAWLVYSLGFYGQLASILALFAAVIVAVHAMMIGAGILTSPPQAPAAAGAARGPKGEVAHRALPGDAPDRVAGAEIFEQMRSNAFITITFFLGVFLSVTYLLAFSLAFHDQGLMESRGVGGLYAAHLVQDPSDATSAGPSATPASVLGAPSAAGNNGQAPATEATALTQANLLYLFESGSSKLLLLEELDANASASHQYMATHNSATHQVVRDFVANLPANNSAALFVVGHANERPVSGPAYSSNYELAMARARSVQHKLLTVFTAMEVNANVRVDVRSASSEMDFHPGVAELPPWAPEEADGRRSAEITMNVARDYFGERAERLDDLTSRVDSRVEDLVGDHPGSRPLKLLDYLYFTIYTITTTGYGDIVPISPTAKLLASVANYFELLFLVIFFNVLLSFYGRAARE